MTAMPDATRPIDPDLAPVLDAVLDTLIPASEDGRMPGAGTLGCAGRVWELCATLPGVRELVAEGLRELETASRKSFGRTFRELDVDRREQLLAQEGFVFPLLIQTYVAYYQHPVVLVALGLEPRPPHPGGYQLAE